jgi:hypothetical protein
MLVLTPISNPSMRGYGSFKKGANHILRKFTLHLQVGLQYCQPGRATIRSTEYVKAPQQGS